MDVDPATFERLLGGLSPAEFEAFVVDLWRARGWTVVREDGRLRTTDRFGEEYVLHVGRVDAGSEPDDAATDLLVTADAGRVPVEGTVAGVVEVVGPADLRRLVQYAVDPATGRSLFVRTFGRPPERERSSPIDRLDRRTVAAALVVVAAVSLVGLVVVADAPGPYGSAADAAATDAATTPAATTTTAPGAATAAALPPGIAPGGGVDAATVARNHREALDGRPYRLVVRYRELGGDETGGMAQERIVVESANAYVTDVFRTGTLSHEPGVVAEVEAYAAGGIRYQRSVDGADPGLGTRSLDSAVAARYADRVERLLREYLSAEESRFVAAFERDGRTHYWLALDGDPGPRATNVTVSLVVDGRGLVHSVRRSYEVPGTDGRSAVVSIRYVEFGDARVTRPDWYERARNRSATRRAALPTDRTTGVAAELRPFPTR
jgi:hypothetical protein